MNREDGMVGVCRATTLLNYFVNSLVYILVASSVECSTTSEFESLLELPRSHKRPQDRVKSVTHVSVKDFGAKGDGYTSDTEAFKRAWKIACSFSPAVLEVPRGETFVVGPIDFPGGCSSKVSLLIYGKIVAPEEPGLWEGWNPRRWLYFHGVDRLTIKGGGTINGRGSKWWDRSCKINSSNPCEPAPTAITFHRSKKLYIKNLELLNSQQMHMAFTECYNVKVTGLKVTAPPESPNTDGIHISASSQISVKNVAIMTGDDCISITTNSSKVRLRNVTCGPGHGISIGSLGRNNSWAEVHDVLVDGAFLNNTDNGVRIKTWQGGTGFVEQVTFRNIVMENVSNPIIIDQYYCDSFVPCPNQTTNVKVNGVTFSNINGTSATIEAIRFTCSDSFPCQNLYLEDIQLKQALGEPAEAFCWNASGRSSGSVCPSPCFDMPFISTFGTSARHSSQ
ncbi:probable polygalacturonase At1g80170 [Nymphaea colorata]|nr:probable polygalacturonase At1g80170 [Nymphaea colorata]XP_031489185.1 probable polygalacturonase At1g80170 [Nymphaea colorata]XP_031489186.1 probable polygalacturonase At1g80170 [Nymphaea colorata]